MNQSKIGKRMVRSGLFYLIGAFGLFSLIILGLALVFHFRQIYDLGIFVKLLFYAGLFLVFYDWAIELPSGAKWKPVIVFVLLSMIIFPFPFSLFVVVPGLLVSAIRKGEKPWDFLTTLGHLSTGMTLGGLLFHRLLGSLVFNHVKSLFVLILAFLVHLIVNRLVSVLILTYRRNNLIQANMKAVVRDINWTYLCVYSLGFVMVLLDGVYSYLGSIAAIIVLISLANSVGYYQKYKMISKTAFIDGLTKAENRASWEVFKDQMNNEPQSGTLVMLDLDEFKEINDTYGHAEGDAVLKELVHHIQTELYQDHRLFRYGGDEFVLCIPHDLTDSKLVKNQVKRVLEEINRKWKRRDLPVSVSCGLTEIEDSSDIHLIFERADSLMYKDKQGKKAL